MTKQSKPQKGVQLNCRCDGGDRCSHADGPNVLCQNCGCSTPFTAYEITDEMVRRAQEAFERAHPAGAWPADRIMRAALEEAING